MTETELKYGANLSDPGNRRGEILTQKHFQTFVLNPSTVLSFLAGESWPW
jgi:hypothetical protein